MSVEIPIELSAAQAHEAAIDDVNRWRGRCVECFARLERAIADALEATIGASSSSKRVPLTFGDKAKALRAAISPDGPFADARLLKAFHDAEPLLDQRNLLVHACGKVWIDAGGNWAWSYRFKPAGKADHVGLYEQKAAHQFELQLARASQGLCSRLRDFSQKRGETRPRMQ